MCNLYSITKNPDAIRQLFASAKDSAGNYLAKPQNGRSTAMLGRQKSGRRTRRF
jgi:hypothetical protein